MSAEIDLKIKIAGVVFDNPVWVASGTFGYGKIFEEFVDLKNVGAVVTKTITSVSREGNPAPRVVETSAGLLNSIGLENKGVTHFKEECLPFLKNAGAKAVVSVAGKEEEDILDCVDKLSDEDIAAIEVNLSCPNVTHKDTKYSLIAQDPESTEKIIAEVKKRSRHVIIAKLTPNVTDISEIALRAEAGGADAVALVNTYMGMAVDAQTMRPVLGNVIGGLSGPAIKPMALKAVWDVYKKISIPVIGIGGIMTGIDVAEFMLCGARAVQVGTANLIDPDAQARILSEFIEYLEEKNITSAGDLVGKLKTM